MEEDEKAHGCNNSSKQVKEKRNSSAYFQAVKTLSTKEAAIFWAIQTLFPSKSDREIAELVATYFNSISSEYVPLERRDEDEEGIISIEKYEIAARLRTCKKPKSQVRGDIPPKIIAENADLLAIPLAHVFNSAITNAEWPALWKMETVTVIPKNSAPSTLSELRNLSCTPLFSKVLEYFVLENLKSKIKLSESQFRGIKGLSTDHFLVSSWQKILNHLEDPDAAVNVLSIDFEKAFNRMDHKECLNATLV